MYAPYAQQQQYAQYSTTIYQERMLYPPPLSHNPHGDIPIIPQPIMHRLPGPIPAERLDPPPRTRSHHGHDSDGRGEHRSKSRSRTSSTHSSNRGPGAYATPVVPPVPVLPPLYGPPRTQYQPEPESYFAEAAVGAYNQAGYLASTNAQLAAAAQYDVDAEAADTPIPGGLRRCREALEQEERERRRQKKRANRRSRSVGDFAEYRPQPQPAIAQAAHAIYSNPSAARSNASIASSKSSKSRSKSSKHHPHQHHHLQVAPPVPALPRMRSRQNLVIPSPLKLTRSNGKTETTNTFSAGMQVEHLASPYRQPAASAAPPMDPWGFDEHPELGARPYKSSIYGNPRLAASATSLYAPRAPQYENMPPVPPVPVEYYHEKRGGFFKRLVGRS